MAHAPTAASTMPRNTTLRIRLDADDRPGRDQHERASWAEFLMPTVLPADRVDAAGSAAIVPTATRMLRTVPRRIVPCVDQSGWPRIRTVPDRPAGVGKGARGAVTSGPHPSRGRRRTRRTVGLGELPPGSAGRPRRHPRREGHRREDRSGRRCRRRLPGNQFNGAILPALPDLVGTGTIRLLDLMFIHKDADGTVGSPSSSTSPPSRVRCPWPKPGPNPSRRCPLGHHYRNGTKHRWTERVRGRMRIPGRTSNDVRVDGAARDRRPESIDRPAGISCNAHLNIRHRLQEDAWLPSII